MRTQGSRCARIGRRLGAVVLGIAASAATHAVEPPTARGKVAGGAYELQPLRIASGGRTVTGASWSLWGTIGQHEARVVIAEGGQYAFEGGLHAVADPQAPLVDALFADGFE
ncbi:MAG TPA: hypothetical protein VND91_03245 [Candidatus Saccharimonadia bacterium]|nr:hypothetical protein [Candidatus Saccharimonadia bacterium]